MHLSFCRILMQALTLPFSGANGHVYYGGVTVDGFVISPETGVISLTKILDREHQEHYSITGNLPVPVDLALR